MYDTRMCYMSFMNGSCVAEVAHRAVASIMASASHTEIGFNASHHKICVSVCHYTSYVQATQLDATTQTGRYCNTVKS